jgi:hypothetical protein
MTAAGSNQDDRTMAWGKDFGYCLPHLAEALHTMSKTVLVVLRWCGAHWYATSWIVLAAYLLICGLFRPSDNELFGMIVAPIGACAFMVAFFSPFFIVESDAAAHRRVPDAPHGPGRLALNRPRLPRATVPGQTARYRSRALGG